jgi:hypothetical protein
VDTANEKRGNSNSPLFVITVIANSGELDFEKNSLFFDLMPKNNKNPCQLIGIA